LLLLRARRNQRSGAVELIDDFEDRLLAPFRRCVPGEQSANSEVSFSALTFRDQRVGRFVDAVVDETIGIVGEKNEFRPQRVL
jgi:hypothetical protein